jgi:hypothetical protein
MSSQYDQAFMDKSDLEEKYRIAFSYLSRFASIKTFSPIDVPGLHLAKMIGGMRLHGSAHAQPYACVTFARNISDFFLAYNCATDVIVGGDVDQARLRTIRDGRPVLAAM